MIRFAVTCLVLVAAPAAADPTADVLATVDKALAAINTHDARLFQAVMLPEAVIVAQSYGTDGSLKTGVTTVAEMAKRLSIPGHKVDERVQSPQVLIRNDLAHVWSPYTLDVDGKRVHCGIDSFGLAKIKGQWRITSLTWTGEPKGCPK